VISGRETAKEVGLSIFKSEGDEIQSGDGPSYPSLERRFQMKTNTFFKLSTVASIVLALSALAFRPAFAASPIEMKAVAFLPTTTHETKFFVEFIEDVQKRTQGQVKIKFLGGPEVISSREQIDALQSGVVQIALIPPSYYAKRVPAISAKYLGGTITEMRKNGFYDILVELTEKAEMRFLGEVNSGSGMYLITNFPVKDPRTDFKGKKIRTVETYDKFIQGLGAAGVVVPRTDIYSAMERHVIDGFFANAMQIFEFGLTEVVKYVIHPAMWWGGAIVNLNLDTWGKLPREIQKTLLDTMIEKERKWESLFERMDREARAKLNEKGIKEIKFSPEDEKWFVNLALTKEWEDVLKDDPVNGERLRKISSRK
jgi:TRAP-type C4-dicarboxylate transport system substrate-binding protein